MGFDLASSPERLAALERARDTGEPQTTRPIRLIQEVEDSVGFLIVVPVYGGGSMPTTVRARRSALIGLGLGVFRVAGLIEGLLPVGDSSKLGLILSEHDASRAAPFYSSVPTETIAAARGRLAETQDLRLPGRQWSVAFWLEDAGQRGVRAVRALGAGQWAAPDRAPHRLRLAAGADPAAGHRRAAAAPPDC